MRYLIIILALVVGYQFEKIAQQIRYNKTVNTFWSPAPTWVFNKPYNSQVQKWACDLINNENLASGGCYDQCLAIAELIETSPEIDKKYYKGIAKSLLVTDEYSEDIQNACAIIMYGAEY